jgi:hypothetical protein
MPNKDLSISQKRSLKDRLDRAGVGTEQNIAIMIQVLDGAGDRHNSLKLKQALLSFRVVYNRARLKLQS